MSNQGGIFIVPIGLAKDNCVLYFWCNCNGCFTIHPKNKPNTPLDFTFNKIDPKKIAEEIKKALGNV